MELHEENRTTVPDIKISTIDPKPNDKIEKAKTPRNRRSCLYRSSIRVVGLIESVCGMWGTLVATHPWKAVILSLLFVALSGSGLYNLTFEFRPYKLWVKEPSEFKEVHEWRMKNYPANIRKHIGIWEMDNVLTSNAIKQMWILHQKVSDSASSKHGVRYEDVCFRVPSLIALEETHADYSYVALQENNETDYVSDYDYKDYYDNIEKQEKDTKGLSFPDWLSSIDEKKPQVSSDHYISEEDDYEADRADHCKYVEELDIICYEESLLEVWGYHDDIINSLTDDKVIKDINEYESSKVTGFPRNITSYLGGIERDTKGKIISARGALQVWYTSVDMEAIQGCEGSSCNFEIDLGSGEQVDIKGMEWEIHLVEVVDGLKALGMPINLQASYLFGAVHRSALFKDFVWVCAGWVLLTFYVLLTLGKPFSSQSRIFPVLVGITCVGLSVLASYGICTVSGIPYGPLNSVLPVLLVALGVDDMYVILNAWEAHGNSFEVQDVKSIATKALHQAGLAITVTSLTDVIAFVIGATTDVPALRHFCVYAAVGIAVVYALQMTLFVGSMVLHQRREKKSALLPSLCCLKKSGKTSETNFFDNAMGMWAKFLLRPPVTVFVLIATGFFLGGGLCQVLELKQRFESRWLLPKSSDIYRWFTTMDEIFPKDGREGFIYFEGVQLPEELPELQALTEALTNLPFVSRVDAWYDRLMDFINKEAAFRNKNLTEEVFQDALSYFLFNEEGAKYRNDFIFANDSKLNCSQPAPRFSIFKINFQYFRLDNNAQERQDAMYHVRNLVSRANVTGYKAPWVLSYGQWETENVISVELLRNLIVVLVIVFVMTMVLLASVRAAILVLVCVLSTLLCVAALMHLWGLTINTVTCIALVIAIGICVDYAAHITHGFLITQGTNKFRAEAALRHMGSAVFNGGMSTLIAFVFLAPSDTFIFISYFKILTGVAVFGLFHALVLLPVLLALVGPPPYPESQTSPDDSQSCTTESTNYATTPNSITPAHTPQSTTPNSPSSSRSESSPDVSKHSTVSSKHLQVNVEDSTSLGKSPPESKSDQNNVLGRQALHNLNFIDYMHKINMVVEGEKTANTPESLKQNSKINSKHKENVVKIYVKK